MQRQYPFSEDTQLLIEVASQLKGERCLEIGCGSCHVLNELSKNFSLAIGTDILRPEGRQRLSFVQADRATCFRDEVFDFVVCNPPYLPSEEILDLAVDAGKGCEVVVSFIREAHRVLRKGGKFYLLISSLTNQGILDVCRELFEVRKVREKKLFFETLYVFELTKKK